VGFIDDNPRKIGTLIHGLPVLGARESLSAITHDRGIEAVFIALPSASSRVVRHVVALSRQAGVQEVRIIPGIERVLGGQISFTDLRDVQLADLLAREVVRVDTAQVGDWLRGRVVLVTGAGGSIGSELSRQIARFGPRELVLLDQDESGVFSTEHEIRRPGLSVGTVVADVRDSQKIHRVFQEIHPDVVFHAAAYKHVGMMERCPDEAVLTNIFGTLSVAEASIEAGVEGFVLISTDKAVNPTSVMGATKRAAEQICQVLEEHGKTRFVAVRFGNVLGSRGSVIPLFQEKIRRGEPLTIRGPNMQRYFMAVSEAVLLVLQAGAMGRGSEIFVLDMGEPIKIVDLAQDLIRMHGLEPERDVPIIFTDPEPGEKDFEDLLTAEEGTVATKQDRIFVVKAAAHADPETMIAYLDQLRHAAEAGDRGQVVRALQNLVPMYRPSTPPAIEVSPPTATVSASFGREEHRVGGQHVLGS
jgi:FlaA1/EpsC-like NDP-sugar epimerase